MARNCAVTIHPKRKAIDTAIIQRAAEFLSKHVNADVIVMDATTGLPVEAIYNGLDCTGNMRKHAAVFRLSEYTVCDACDCHIEDAPCTCED